MSMQSYEQILKPVYDLLRRLELHLEKGFPIIPNYLVAVKLKDIESLIDTIYSQLPQDLQEARALLRRSDELKIEAQQKAEKIITDAQNEANRMLSESTVLKAVEAEAERIKEQVITECEEIKRRALEDAENVRLQAADDAMRTREGANIYAEKVFNHLESTFTERLDEVKKFQNYIESLKSNMTDNFDSLKNNYPPLQNNYSNNFNLD